MKIVLIGMAGVGKSCIGRMLADKLDYNFIDVDDSMKEKTGLGTTPLLEKVRDEEFLRIENEVFGIVSQSENTVFAPGGSIIYCPNFYEKLNNFTVIYLMGDMKEVLERVKKTPRGIVYSSKMGMEDLFQERAKLYEKYAHFTVDARGDGKEVANYICDIITSNKKNLC